ncbi:hypothetical protein Peur_043199 [Populus x canadensis]
MLNWLANCAENQKQSKMSINSYILKGFNFQVSTTSDNDIPSSKSLTTYRTMGLALGTLLERISPRFGKITEFLSKLPGPPKPGSSCLSNHLLLSLALDRRICEDHLQQDISDNSWTQI